MESKFQFSDTQAQHMSLIEYPNSIQDKEVSSSLAYLRQLEAVEAVQSVLKKRGFSVYDSTNGLAFSHGGIEIAQNTYIKVVVRNINTFSTAMGIVVPSNIKSSHKLQFMKTLQKTVDAVRTTLMSNGFDLSDESLTQAVA